MDVKLFSLYKQEVPESESGKKRIFECVKSFFPDCSDFANFTSQKRMLLAVSQSLRSADIVIVAVQSNMYNATKRLLSAALDLKMSKSLEVSSSLASMLEHGKIKQATYDTNIVFPIGAEILPTISKINCGFTLTSGGQHIIYLPIEAPRADEVVFGSLYDYLASVCDEETVANAFDVRHTALIRHIAEKLENDSINITFAGAKAVNLIKKYSPKLTAKSCVGFAEDVSFDITTDNLVDEARKIRSDYCSHLAVAVSDIVTEPVTEERSLSASIADEQGTSTIKMYAEKDESDADFLLNFIDKLMLTLCDYKSLASCGNDADTVTKSDKVLRRNLFTIASGTIGLTAIIGFIVALFLNNGGH